MVFRLALVLGGMLALATQARAEPRGAWSPVAPTGELVAVCDEAQRLVGCAGSCACVVGWQVEPKGALAGAALVEVTHPLFEGTGQTLVLAVKGQAWALAELTSAMDRRGAIGMNARWEVEQARRLDDVPEVGPGLELGLRLKIETTRDEDNARGVTERQLGYFCAMPEGEPRCVQALVAEREEVSAIEAGRPVGPYFGPVGVAHAWSRRLVREGARVVTAPVDGTLPRAREGDPATFELNLGDAAGRGFAPLRLRPVKAR